MKFWIARGKSGILTFHCGQTRYINGIGWINVYAILNSSLFSEVTFENSPQEVELKLVK